MAAAEIEAEREYRIAKGDVIELDTGARPDWAPRDGDDEHTGDG